MVRLVGERTPRHMRMSLRPPRLRCNSARSLELAAIMKLLAFFCFLSAACVGTVLSHGLISQSAIYQCDWGDETEPTVSGAEPCKQKFVVSMALSSGQVCRCEFITAPAVSIYLFIYSFRVMSNHYMQILTRHIRRETLKCLD